MLANVSQDLARSLAEDLDFALPAAQARVLENPPTPEVTVSEPLSLFAKPGDGRAATRKVAIIVADGVDSVNLIKLNTVLTEAGVKAQYVGECLGQVTSDDGKAITVDVTFEATASVLWDCVVLPKGQAAIDGLTRNDRALTFVKEQYRHCKPIIMFGDAQLLDHALGHSIDAESLKNDWAIASYESSMAEKTFSAKVLESIAKHRNFDRELTL